MLSLLRHFFGLSLVAILAACSDGSAVIEARVEENAGPDNFEVSRLLDDIRMQNRLPGLKRSPRLDVAARRHATDMARNGFFSHQSPTTGAVGERVSASGYQWCFVAENIARGQRTEAVVLNSWLRSPGHRKNILSKRAEEFGFARASEPGAAQRPVWVMVLAGRRCR
ncbi:CAP domain-containing protein [Pontibaca salina]|uniref:CAP domain-containing protein n=1 Tax=Pontibaca salina TaxID=2795731 RepID=A0A934HRG5_9RHOB|nr:CAP domain-containing protein [Pontibaca salina]MBI6630097.1 CAP domain-containing protein [Pontibaca salina]